MKDNLKSLQRIINKEKTKITKNNINYSHDIF